MRDRDGGLGERETDRRCGTEGGGELDVANSVNAFAEKRAWPAREKRAPYVQDAIGKSTRGRSSGPGERTFTGVSARRFFFPLVRTKFAVGFDFSSTFCRS